MKDKRKDIADPAKSEAKPTSSSVETFLEQVSQTPIVHAAPAKGRLVFALDATMSRQPTWRLAQKLQADMFVAAQDVGGLDVQVVFFRGQNEFRKSGWTDQPAVLADKMSRVHCRGGFTQINRVLSYCDTIARAEPLAAVVYIGDAMEENADKLCDSAAQLSLRGAKLFLFQEGDDHKAAAVFQEMARLSKGVYARFDAGSAQRLRSLLKAAAAYAAGGSAHLKQLAQQDDVAAQLAKQLGSGGAR